MTDSERTISTRRGTEIEKALVEKCRKRGFDVTHRQKMASGKLTINAIAEVDDIIFEIDDNRPRDIWSVYVERISKAAMKVIENDTPQNRKAAYAADISMKKKIFDYGIELFRKQEAK